MTKITRQMMIAMMALLLLVVDPVSGFQPLHTTISISKNHPHLQNPVATSTMARRSRTSSRNDVGPLSAVPEIIMTMDPIITIATPSSNILATTAAASWWTNSDVWVFIAGIFPFAWATIEFWRRIAVGESFGTGSDSVVIIGEDDVPESSRGRRVLGKGALVTAYILFAIAAGVLVLTLYTVITNDIPTPEDLAAAAAAAAGTVDVP